MQNIRGDSLQDKKVNSKELLPARGRVPATVFHLSTADSSSDHEQEETNNTQTFKF